MAKVTSHKRTPKKQNSTNPAGTPIPPAKQAKQKKLKTYEIEYSNLITGRISVKAKTPEDAQETFCQTFSDALLREGDYKENLTIDYVKEKKE